MSPVRRIFLTAASLSVLALTATAAQAQLIGPTPYLSVNQSPFRFDNGFTVENFEDGALNIPGVTANTGFVLTPGSFAVPDSVDADDGVIDGDGSLNNSYFAENGQAGIRFTFNPAFFGGLLPTAAGIVWTDGTNNIRFEAFDQNGVSLSTPLLAAHADNEFDGTTGEDRFYGARNAGGISAILIQNGIGFSNSGIEVDHLQYSFGDGPVPSAAPEPGTLALLGTAGIGIAGMILRKRRRL